jgi:23S rRNA (guanosine2251-2'-O)-methyltransferase
VTKDQPRNRHHSNFRKNASAERSKRRPGAGEDRFASPEKRRFSQQREESPLASPWIWGFHASRAALINPRRRIAEIAVTENAAQRVASELESSGHKIRRVTAKELEAFLPEGAVHQGIALRVEPLVWDDIETIIANDPGPLAILDSVTDPQNVGAVFRCAAAFGIRAIILQTRNAPAMTGALVKAAVGAVETVTEVRVVNISRTIEMLKDAGWRVIGLSGEAEASLHERIGEDRRIAIVLGAEGEGLRQGVAKACSEIARIPISGAMESLNVSAAAAIAFYELSRSGAP